MPKIFDAHFHIIDPKYPLIENQGFIPEPFKISDYQQKTAGYELRGGAVVSGSFQGYDQTYLLEALRVLGPQFAGVTQLRPDISDREILTLAQAGVKAVRLNMKRGGASVLAELEATAKRVNALAGWHVELYIDAKDLPDISHVLKKLSAVSIDHLGLSEEGLPHLLRLVEKGIKVKATGFGRCDFHLAAAVSAIYEVNPEALMFGTDLPSTRAPRPFQHEDVILIQNTLSAEAAANVLYRNAEAWYLRG